MQGQHDFSSYNHYIDEQNSGPTDNMSRYWHEYDFVDMKILSTQW